MVTRYRSSETPNKDAKQLLVRLDETAERLLKGHAAASNVSKNAVVNQAIIAYCTTTPVTVTAARLDTYSQTIAVARQSDAYQNAVTRLGGGEESPCTSAPVTAPATATGSVPAVAEPGPTSPPPGSRGGRSSTRRSTSSRRRS